MRDSLDETISLASSRRRVSVKINKVELAKRFKDLFDVRFVQVEMERTDVECRSAIAVGSSETLESKEEKQL